MAAQSLHILMIFVLSAATSSHGSVCTWHPQQKFCDAGFVVRARVESLHDGSLPNVVRQPRFPNQVYTLKVLEIFKGDQHVRSNLYNSNKLTLYTPSKDDPSKVRPLEKDTEYLVSGDIKEGKLYTSCCGWQKKWNHVTAEQRAGVRTQYKKGCRCLIGFCPMGFRMCNHLMSGCGGFDRKLWKCREKHQHCEVNRTGLGCAWVNNVSFRQCNRPLSVLLP